MRDPYRPLFHLTAPSGWLNDPHGITYINGAYEVFYQHNPSGPMWSEHASWGHASTTDFARWIHHPVALAPGGGDEGCWSGCVVLDDDGSPRIFFTSIRGLSPWEQRISAARGSGDLLHWRKLGDVIAGPPKDLPTSGFRDPFVWRGSQSWNMIVGAGIVGGGGGVVAYTSQNLQDWEYQRVLATAMVPDSPSDGTTEIWECPQYFIIDGHHVLIFSLWRDDVLTAVHYATGQTSPDGNSFVAQHWGRLDYGTEFYAATSFVDRDGRRAVMGWSWEARDDPSADEGQTWAGTLSVPRILRVGTSGQLCVTPMELPDDAFSGSQLTEIHLAAGAVETIPIHAKSGVMELSLTSLQGRGGLRIIDTGSDQVHLEVVLDTSTSELSTEVGAALSRDRPRTTRNLGDALIVGDASQILTVILDQSIVEVFHSSGNCFTHRVYPAPDSELQFEVFAGDNSSITGVVSVRTFLAKA